MRAEPIDADTEDPRRARIAIALRDLATRAVALDPGRCGDEAGAVEVLATEICEHLDHVVRLFAELEERDTEPAPEPDLALGDPLEDTWLGMAPAGRAPALVADTCFAGRLELGQARRRLHASGDVETLLAAVDSARRKLVRAVRAVLAATHEVHGLDVLGGEHQWCHGLADLESGLEVRRLYAAFRARLRRPQRAEFDDVMAAVRYAAFALASLFAAPSYESVRASDRIVLRRLQTQALTWARHDRTVAKGLHVLEDVWTCADLLRGINRRQELRNHDALVIASLLDEPFLEPRAWLEQLESLRGLDDDLDRLIVAARHEPLDPLREAILAQLAVLR